MNREKLDRRIKFRLNRFLFVHLSAITTIWDKNQGSTIMGKIEKAASNLCDFIIGAMLLFLLYQLFFGSEFSGLMEEGGGTVWAGIILGVGMLWLGGKFIKAILCAIARAFDVILGGDNKNESN